MKPGTIKYTAVNLTPSVFANKKCKVITFNQFKNGKPKRDLTYHWKLSDIQQAVFIKFEDGTVDMTGAGSLFDKPGQRA